MNKPVLSLLFFLLLAQCNHAQAAEAPGPEQLHQIEILQRRADSMTFGELDPDDYHLEKAKAWLAMALRKYHDKDTTGSLTASVEQAQMLLDALEAGQSDISKDTPLEIPGSEAIRPDLLKAIDTLKRHAKFACGQRSIAAAEVQLIWAGHDFHESGQSHAEPHINSVVNLIYDAQVAIDNCPEVPPVRPSPHEQNKVMLESNALFAFNKAHLNPGALWRLDKLTLIILKESMPEEVILVGHTDSLRRDGRSELNQRLSEKRAESIKRYLIGKGVSEKKIMTVGIGSAQPVVECPKNLSRSQQIACQAPNRRVEIILRGVK